jgi:hypothetical protein
MTVFPTIFAGLKREGAEDMIVVEVSEIASCDHRSERVG